MTPKEERSALRQMERGDPKDLIRLLEYEIKNQEREIEKKKPGCCGGPNYQTNINFLKQKIKYIKQQKRFRGMDL